MTTFRRILLIFTGLIVLLSSPALPARSAQAILSVPFSQVYQSDTTRVFLPLISKPAPIAAGEWTQHAHDALHTSYTSQSVPTPWRWKWSWNGPDSLGRVSSGKFSLPRNTQPVTGGGRVYIAAGSRGVYALDQQNGGQLWNRNPGGAINSTPAYDPSSDSLFVVSSNGRLYRLNASTGQTTGEFNSGAASDLPLPPALYAGRVYFSMGTRVYAIDSNSMQPFWSYNAASNVHTPPAFSPSTGLVVAISEDLYVHAIRDADGSRAWRSKPTPLNPGEPGSSSNNAEVKYGWPVIAEGHGLVLIKLRLDWQTMWTWSPWPTSNATMRSNLSSRPDEQALFALRLSDGNIAFRTNVGHGGFGDGGYMPMGPQPVVKRFDDGTEVAYVVMRGSPCLVSGCDGRGDSRLGEMLLDGQTITGFQAGDVRFMQNTYFPTDEQANLSMAGNDIFGGHWMFGLAHRILDRSPSRGSSANNAITVSNLPHIITSASNCGFSSTHYCSTSLVQDGDPRNIPAGFYIYYNQGKVYDQYWGAYAVWVVSNNLVLFRSNDGAVVALETGNPTSLETLAETNSLPSLDSTPPTDIPPSSQPELINVSQAQEYAGKVATVEGEVKYIFNNGKNYLLGFAYPHQGVFKALIPIPDWQNFDAPPDTLFTVGQQIQVSGLIEWYQGDPVIYVHRPDQIQILP
ncbi:protein containing PQQ-like domain [Anaerolinea thermolimosa]|uniref:outer membrane protein assembly factor BamB family protein n=1 Tax=Anaerolinea thermolimosa TaxID=229919 RepID=UPI0007834D3B|nr:PQQ-binding-like beta-propeller repeat protein [Anaerolinea thermolimosa]GAP06847.1 protein containing PQQ-like domain [Anaerolinea thermolimosa]